MREFVEFLGSRFPYDQLDHRDLDALAREVEVEFFAGGSSADRLERPVTAFARPPVWCPPDARVRDAASAMTAAGRSSALVDVGGKVGVVDDEAMRRRVATGEVPLDAPLHVLAHVPAPSVPDTATVGAASLHMVEHGVSHLVVVGRDGLPCGVASVLDLAAVDLHHPLAVRSAVAAARTLDELTAACALLRPTLVELWDADVSSRHRPANLLARRQRHPPAVQPVRR